jgi:iron complex outermembrane receptor protein
MKTMLSLIFLASGLSGFGQSRQDTTKKLKEVVIRPYFSTQPLLRSTGAVTVLDSTVLKQQPNQSFVSAMNTVAGVRMEERSPGSYRLSIRGSLLRSPFGIRNVKIYFDEYPLTDAGGNSYFNALDISSAGNIQLLKGPQSSIYGANSGGVILLNSPRLTTDSTLAALNITGGSFGLFRENVVLGKQWKNYQFSISQSYQRSDGYRDHSGMERKYIQLHQQWDYARTASLSALFFYSDLHYDTPGGLTAVQYALDPKLSRPAAGAIPSAIDQQAGIYSKTTFGGITNTWQIDPHFKHVVSVFSTYTDFKNPFITNYEHRKEFTFGLRTYVEYEKKAGDINWRFNLGAEGSKTKTDFTNSDNLRGVPMALQAADKLKAASNFAFAHLNVDIHEKLLLELSSSLNLYQYKYESFYPVIIAEKTNKFDTQLMPRAALSYLLNKSLTVRGSVSKGYSPPTLAEIRASDNVINVDLQPENGWNYETGLSYKTTDNRLFADVTGFYFHLKNSIVRRLNDNDTEYFINAGGTKQWGLEMSLAAWLIPVNDGMFIRGLQFRSAYTLSRFRFDNYFDRTVDLSGKSLTGVPKNVVVNSIDIQFPAKFYAFVQHSYTSRIPLNDPNTIYSTSYHLLQAKAGWKNLHIGKIPVELFVGADNLLNKKYSLGNDLNAANGRYFNAAATRNFYGGLSFYFNK